MSVCVVCAQFEPKLNQYHENIDRMCAMIEQAMDAYPKTQVIVFPELSTTGYECEERFQEFAEVLNDPTAPGLSKIGAVAKKRGVYVVYGMAERAIADEPLLYNSSVMLDSNGRVVGAYRKAQLFDTEKRWFTPGNEYPVFDTPFGKVGMFICFDTFFPEIARIEALRGADLFLVSTNWEKPYEYDFDTAMTARAMDNVTYLAVANRLGFDKTLGFFGHSRILDPLGRPLAIAESETEQVIYAELDYQVAKDLKRDYYTFFQDRQPESYGDICKR